MMTLDDFMKDQMKDPEFAKAYEEIQPEMSVIRALRPERLKTSRKKNYPKEQVSLKRK